MRVKKKKKYFLNILHQNKCVWLFFFLNFFILWLHLVAMTSVLQTKKDFISVPGHGMIVLLTRLIPFHVFKIWNHGLFTRPGLNSLEMMNS
jgi:hypothetical protein